MSSITEAQAHEAVYQRWKSLWPTLQPTVTYCFENEKFVEPNPATTPWAHVSLKPTDSNQHTLGAAPNRVWLRDAGVWVRLHVPLNAGVGSVTSLVGSVRSVFEGASFGGVSSVNGVRTVPVGSNGRWYEVVVISPVNYYEIR